MKIDLDNAKILEVVKSWLRRMLNDEPDENSSSFTIDNAVISEVLDKDLLSLTPAKSLSAMHDEAKRIVAEFNYSSDSVSKMIKTLRDANPDMGAARREDPDRTFVVGAPTQHAERGQHDVHRNGNAAR